jgi:leucyl-tRNA synthetase
MTQREYDPQAIELKWQAEWERSDVYKCENPKKGEKARYYLDMFPYPSGSGLHLGHPVGYLITDITARFERMNGVKVLHPMGWDAFGLPAEQHAISTGEHPAIVTQKNCTRFREQMKRIGFSYDWSRELSTTDVEYYKWTQWIFLKLYNSFFDEKLQKARPISELEIPADVKKAGEVAINKFQAEYRLAYYTDAMVNWCPGLGTVLANEEVIDGKSERGGFDVVRKPMKQWMLRITKYSERLLSELDAVDWPECIKEQQRNWIGKKTGAEISFKVHGTAHSVVAFTTRPDTLFGVTFFVVSPEHPLVDLVTTSEASARVKKYCDDASKLSEFDRTIENRKKTGVFTGSYVVNPITEEKVPLYIGDYVLASVGTGAVMGVPAHDDRDFEFARLFNLDIRPVLKPASGDAATIEAIVEGEVSYTGDGIMLAQNKFPIAIKLGLQGKTNAQATDSICGWLEANKLGTKVVRYKLRDWLFSRQRYWGEPIPLIHWEDGTVTALSESDLPLVLPEVAEYKPSDSGESPLSRAGDWITVTCPKSGKKGKRETNTMPQWAGSCWYYLRFMDPRNKNAAWDPEIEKTWGGQVDLYVGGAEHAVLHLLYSRFWHKVLFDLGYVSQREPFKKLINQGMLLAYAYKDARGALVPVDEVIQTEDGSVVHTKTGAPVEKIVAKMSKSLRNVIVPDDIINEYGADTLRTYIPFMGPVDASRVFDQKAIIGVTRFLKRSFALVLDAAEKGFAKNETTESARERARLVKRVTDEITNYKLNTAISSMMEFLNAVSVETLTKECARDFVRVLAPFAPHLAEELWKVLGEDSSVVIASWPTYDEKALVESTTQVVVQVAGKKRALLDVDIAITEELLKAEVIKALSSTDYAAKPSDKFITVFKSGTKVPKLVNVILST